MQRDERFIRKLNAFLEPTPEELAFLGRLFQRRRTCPGGETLVTEGQPHAATFIALEGWAARHKTLADGRRQILNVILPGDMIGLDAHIIAEAPASVTTLTACTLAEFPPTATMKMLAEQPRLAAGLLWANAREEAFLGERLLSLGRRPAIDRVGHLFVELYHRLRLVGMAEGNTFRAPLTLDQIADALGLSMVHVSRTLGRLRAQRLLDRRNQKIVLPDLARLEEQVEFPGLYLGRRLEAGERFLRPGFSAADIDSCF